MNYSIKELYYVTGTCSVNIHSKHIDNSRKVYFQHQIKFFCTVFVIVDNKISLHIYLEQKQIDNNYLFGHRITHRRDPQDTAHSAVLIRTKIFLQLTVFSNLHDLLIILDQVLITFQVLPFSQSCISRTPHNMRL